jgi:hypothetical protein
MRRYVLLVVFSLAILPLSVVAQNFRGPVVDRISVGTDGLSSETLIALGDILPLVISGELEFTYGLEVELKIPESLRRYRDAFAVHLYSAVSPSLDPTVAVYRGTRVSFDILPSVSRAFLQVPVDVDHEFERSPDTIRVTQVIDPTGLPLALQVLPIMKGLPSDVANARIGVTARAMRSNKGAVALDILGREGEGFSVFIDDEPVPYPRPSYILKPGLHTLRIESPFYSDVVQSFGVEIAQTTEVSVILESVAPQVSLDVPSGTEVLVDGERFNLLPGESIEMEAGEHTFVFNLGDYSITRKVTVERGKNYAISLVLDILVEED